MNFIINTTNNLNAKDPSTGAVHSGPARHIGGAPQPRVHTGGPLPGDHRKGVRAGVHAGLHREARRPGGALRGGPLPEGRRTGAPHAGLHKEARRPSGAPGGAPQGGAGTGEPRPRIPLWLSTTGAQQKTGMRNFTLTPIIRSVYDLNPRGNLDKQ